MSADDDLDTELRRLFGDDRLGMHPRAGADQAIVAGARRIRRRRKVVTASGGALGVAILVAGGLVLGGYRPGQPLPPVAEPAAPVVDGTTITPPPPAPPPVAQPPVEAPSPTQAPAHTPAPPTSGTTATDTKVVPTFKVPVMAGPALGPDGYKTLRLGMSYEQAKATGALDDGTPPAAECQSYRLKEGANEISMVTISPNKGVVLFEAARAHSPAGIAVGSPETALKQAYPSWNDGPNGGFVPTGDQGGYRFAVDNGAVSYFSLEGNGQDCSG
ncbi:hypothetical protein [Amycolatopsis nigrescens]|uniref:hypothetical protein n=1 Tax=Amycolatopsis nigrescens TaxID=381445 RepID=UPI00037214BE|nr:hypothetical protein [Amycolatopsis nigrescens]